MQILLNFGIILLCCAALWKGASWLVDSAARIAQRFGVSELVIGLTVVAFGTSAPEFAVTIDAALRGHESVSIGNVVGSNIFNIGFILGGCAIVRTIKIKPVLVRRDGLLLLGITVVLLALLANGRLGRIEGAGLFLLLIVYLIYLFKKRQVILEEELPVGVANWRDGLMLLLGLGFIIGGGHFLVASSLELAEIFGLSEGVIAVTVVAAGTSVPEFAISLVALIKKHHGISAGNLVGSNLFNTLGVLGIAGAIRPLAVESSVMASMTILVGLTGLVILFLRTGWRLSRWEGITLVLVSLATWVYIFSNTS